MQKQGHVAIKILELLVRALSRAKLPPYKRDSGDLTLARRINEVIDWYKDQYMW